MIDSKKVEDAIREFCKNEKWDRIFRNAPGGAMERLAIAFYFSENGKGFSKEEFDEYHALRDEIEKTLDEEDLVYLIDNIGKEESIKHYKDLLETLKKNGGQPAGKNLVGGGLADDKQ